MSTQLYDRYPPAQKPENTPVGLKHPTHSTLPMQSQNIVHMDMHLPLQAHTTSLRRFRRPQAHLALHTPLAQADLVLLLDIVTLAH